MKTHKYKVIYQDLIHHDVTGFMIIDSSSAQKAVNEIREMWETQKSIGHNFEYHIVSVLLYCENWY